MRSDLTVEVEGVDELLKKFSELDRALRAEQTYVNKAGIKIGPAPGQSLGGPSTELRRASKDIATLLARLIRITGGGPTPQGAAAAATARPKSDRKPVVSLGSVAIKIGSHSIPSGGGKRSGGGGKRSRAGAVAHGTNYGPKGGHLPGTVVAGLAGRFTDANFYNVGRNDGGYYVEQVIERTGPQAAARYRKALAEIAKKWGMT